MTLEVSITCEAGADSRPAPSYDELCRSARESRSAHAAQAAHLMSVQERLDRWIRRSTSDLEMMMTETPRGLYPYAGIPWFSTPFGRDGLITAFEMLWADPDIARGVLSFLADTQATAYSDAAGCAARQDPARDARRRDARARRSAVRALLRHRRRHAAVRHARRCLRRAHGRSGFRQSTVAAHCRGAGLDGALRRPGRRWLHRIRAPQRDRARPAGLEGFAGFRLPRRWHPGRAADCALRSAGVCVRRVGRRGAARRDARRH